MSVSIFLTNESIVPTPLISAKEAQSPQTALVEAAAASSLSIISAVAQQSGNIKQIAANGRSSIKLIIKASPRTSELRDISINIKENISVLQSEDPLIDEEEKPLIPKSNEKSLYVFKVSNDVLKGLVLPFLTPKELATVQCVSKSFFEVCKENSLWRIHCGPTSNPHQIKNWKERYTFRFSADYHVLQTKAKVRQNQQNYTCRVGRAMYLVAVGLLLKSIELGLTEDNCEQNIVEWEGGRVNECLPPGVSYGYLRGHRESDVPTWNLYTRCVQEYIKQDEFLNYCINIKPKLFKAFFHVGLVNFVSSFSHTMKYIDIQNNYLEEIIRNIHQPRPIEYFFNLGMSSLNLWFYHEIKNASPVGGALLLTAGVYHLARIVIPEDISNRVCGTVVETVHTVAIRTSDTAIRTFDTVNARCRRICRCQEVTATIQAVASRALNILSCPFRKIKGLFW